MLATRRRGGMGEAAAVPLALLVVAVFQLAVAPAQNVVSRAVGGRGGLEGAPDDPRPGGRARALPRVRRDVARRPEPADLGATSCSQTHPTLAQRVAMAEAWAARQSSRPRSSD